MQASKLVKGDVVFYDGLALTVKEAYQSNPGSWVIAFEEGYGVNVYPDADLLVSRKGQVL